MDANELVRQADRIREAALTEGKGVGAYAQALEFLKKYGGPDNSFLERLESIEERKKNRGAYAGEMTAGIMEAFSEYVKSGLFTGGKIQEPSHKPVMPQVALPQEPRFDYLDELLKRAGRLINDENAHAGAPVPLIGSALELFLKQLVEKNKLDTAGAAPNVFTCGQCLLNTGFISRQDMKNISLWGAMLEDSDSGSFDKLEEQDKITAMLQGVRALVEREFKNNRGITAVKPKI